MELPAAASRLLDLVTTHEARVGVVGLGYVGLPFAVEKAKVGFRVIGVEQNVARAEDVAAGRSYISDVDSADLAPLVAAGLIEVDTDFERVAEMDVVVVCVPTPLTKNLTPDLSYVESVCAELGARLRPGQLVVLESTTYPGTTEEVMLPRLALSGLEVEREFFLAHSPERVDPGNLRYTTRNTTKVVGGYGPVSLAVAAAFYRMTISQVVEVSSASAAELTKVFENTYRAVNIALVNELTMLCDRMGLNVWEVLGAAFTKPFGIQPFWPGPGVGGHCIPLDPHYLEWKAREYNFSTRFIALAGEINRRMPDFVVHKALRILGDDAIAPRGARVLVLGAAYKADLDDWRESPAIEVMEGLLSRGCEVVYHDPYVPSIQVGHKHLDSVPLTTELLTSTDLVIITTAHRNVDHGFVVRHAPRVLDTRNATAEIDADTTKLVLL